jgi:GT2 family glycosyltransferase
MQKRRSESVEAYLKAVSLAPENEFARAEVAGHGLKHRLPRLANSNKRSAELSATLSVLVEELRRALNEIAVEANFSADAWDAFRQAFPTFPPPVPSKDGSTILVIVDARTASPHQVRSTLVALSNQTDRDWSALIVATEHIADHPVASRVWVDPRLTFVGDVPDALADHVADGPAHLVLLSGDTCLDPQALSWLRFAAAESGGEVIYGDHDHRQSPKPATITLGAPVLFARPEFYDLLTTPVPPAVLLLAGADVREAARTLMKVDGFRHRRDILLTRVRSGAKIVHLPVVLSSVNAAPEVHEKDFAPLPAMAPADSLRLENARIRVVVPTRDQAALLKACVASLRSFAARPDLLEIIVLDNRSVDAPTRALLARLARTKGVVVKTVDEPFNWSRFNNLGVEACPSDIFIFANNDIEMLTRGWDDVVRRRLSDPGVGVLGARLFYEDRTIQHAGIVIGAVGGRPIHEGRGAHAEDGGPLGRWRRTREAAAVTGAFMAIRSEVFQQVDGFNTSLAIAYNDVDFCFRVRNAGFAVLYAAEIEAIHYESKTRGFSVSEDKTAWDDAEFEELVHLWGDNAMRDQFVSPCLTFAAGGAIDGFKPPSVETIMKAILE